MQERIVPRSEAAHVKQCELRAANGLGGIECEGESCVYWRLVDHLGLVEGVDEDGCAVQHFELLEGGAAVAEWLLSVKQRLETQGLTLSVSPQGAASVQARD
jgi:hypothetical protein